MGSVPAKLVAGTENLALGQGDDQHLETGK